MTHLIIGIDVAKQTLAVAGLIPGTRPESWGEYANTPAGFQRLEARIAQICTEPATSDVLVVVEPTGGYELALASWADAHGWRVSRPNPKRVRDWAKSQGRRAKTDRLDALDLARYGADQPAAPWKPLPEPYAHLDSLLRRREDLEKMRQEERNRQAALVGKPGVAAQVGQTLTALLEALESALAQVEQALQGLLASQPAMQAKVRLLRSVPGLGARNVLPVLVLLARWEALTDGQGQAKGLVAFTGLDPQTYRSGTSVHKPARISRMGNRSVRSLLYMGALGGVSGHNPLRDFYQRLVGRGKAKKLALVAGARKILTWAWAVFRTNTAFDPQRASRRQPVPA
jgi:transposase